RRTADLAAHAALTDGVNLMRATALLNAGARQPTLAEQAFADALAWRAALRARMQSENDPVPADAEGAIGAAPGACPVRGGAAPRLANDVRALLPAGAAWRVRLGGGGQVLDGQLAAAVPADLRAPLSAATPSWTFTRAPGAPQGCRLEGVRYI